MDNYFQPVLQKYADAEIQPQKAADALHTLTDFLGLLLEIHAAEQGGENGNK